MHQSIRPAQFYQIAKDIIGTPPRVSGADGFGLVSDQIRTSYQSGAYSDIDILSCALEMLYQENPADAFCVLSAFRDDPEHGELFREFSQNIAGGLSVLTYLVRDRVNEISGRDGPRATLYEAIAGIFSGAESVLDVGCGTGFLGEVLKRKSDRIKITGVDFLLRDGPRIATYYDSFEQCDAIAGDRVWDVDATAIIGLFAYVEMDAALAFLRRMKPHTKRFLFNAITSDHVWRDYPKIAQIYDRAEFEAGIRSLGLELLSEKAQDMDRTWYFVAEPSNLSASLWHEHLPALINGGAS